MELKKLEKPDLTGTFDKVLSLLDQGVSFHEHLAKVTHPKYLYWDKARFKHPPELTPEEFWAFVKTARKHFYGRAKTVVRETEGNYFSWMTLPGLDRFLHDVDLNLGGMLESTTATDKTARDRYIARGIMEEAIASSQLEGAHTTRKAAKKMLIEKRAPRNESERMILNNYRGMLLIEDQLKSKALDMKVLMELHATLTRDTIDDSEVGRLRRDSDEVVVVDSQANTINHIPPPEKFLKTEMNRFIQYANDKLEPESFVHPVIKAIILHFWIGYLHPFTDGNGRVARAIFYWYVLRKKYWAFSFLPLSRVIKQSPAQYGEAYLYSEQDDNDLTYFIDYNVRKIIQAKGEFEIYAERKQSENRELAKLGRAQYGLNNRQMQLLRYLHRNPDTVRTIKTHSLVAKVSRMTARKDMERLEMLGFLSSEKIGRERPFSATQKTTELLS